MSVHATAQLPPTWQLCPEGQPHSEHLLTKVPTSHFCPLLTVEHSPSVVPSSQLVHSMIEWKIPPGNSGFAEQDVS